ncbi:ABA4-like family protein [Brevundimonas subvibrioides]|uniref:ABA4-like family protein n=1 Tax=Brevundimonas subvibrioides TaxID=74313 RepID=UPI0022B337EF|nr:ABA4-like family protein [Brevundimonas subvibrioides]
MTLDALFNIANLVALAGWIILAFAPLRRGAIVAAARCIVVALAVAYTILLVQAVAGGGLGGDLTTLSGLTEGFSQPRAVLVGWVHYLAFDLWVGSWAIEDAGKRGVPHWAMLPVLFLTLMAGPIGLLTYLVVRARPGRQQPPALTT